MDRTQRAAWAALIWDDAHKQVCPQGELCSMHGNPYVLVSNYAGIVEERESAGSGS